VFAFEAEVLPPGLTQSRLAVADQTPDRARGIAGRRRIRLFSTHRRHGHLPFIADSLSSGSDRGQQRKAGQSMVARLPRLSPIALGATLAVLAGAPAFAAPDAAAGSKIFHSICGVCHLADKDASLNDERLKIGPNLYGVVGRAAGTHKGYFYSAAMKGSHITWTKEALRPYIHEPQKTIPNVRMSFNGLPSLADVDNVIAYLATLK
jgi:cytochrome c